MPRSESCEGEGTSICLLVRTGVILVRNQNSRQLGGYAEILLAGRQVRVRVHGDDLVTAAHMAGQWMKVLGDHLETLRSVEQARGCPESDRENDRIVCATHQSHDRSVKAMEVGGPTLPHIVDRCTSHVSSAFWQPFHFPESQTGADLQVHFTFCARVCDQEP